MQQKGLAAEVIIHSAVIAHVDGQLPGKVPELEGMRQGGLAPEVITYGAVIGACGKFKQPGSAPELPGGMQRKGLAP